MRGSNRLLEAALAYAYRGWPVLPLHSPNESGRCSCERSGCEHVGKHPRTTHGLKDATTDEITIRAWWQRWPQANIGIAVPLGMVVVDVDGPDGDRALQEAAFALPRTVRSKTGRGSHHVFASEVKIPPRVGVLAHVDLRGPGSYFVAPPSRHASGVYYGWIVAPDGAELAPAPPWLIKLAEAADNGHGPPQHASGTIPKGHRHAALTSLAGTMRRRGMSAEAIEAALIAENLGRCSPPLPEGEVHSIAKSAADWPKEARQPRSSRPPKQGREVGFEDVEPWPETVDGAALLNEFLAVFRRYLDLPSGAAVAIALWILVAHTEEGADVLPLLMFKSPEKECGKTTALRIIQQLVPKPIPASDMSPAAMFRIIEKYRPTLLLDEADAWVRDSEDLRRLLDSGHERDGAYTYRVEGDGGDREVRRFSTWCPKAIASIGRLPDTIESRAIMILMSRARRDPKLQRLLRRDRLALAPLQRQAARWALDSLEALRSARPQLPEQLSGRAADNWTPLLAVAEHCGGCWPDEARLAAVKLAGTEEGDDDSPRVQVLGDLRRAFEETRKDRLTTDEVLQCLHSRDDRPWSEWRDGKPITAVQLSRLVRPFRIRPTQFRHGGDKLRGYVRGDCQEAFDRYLPPSNQVHPVQGPQDAV